MKKITVTKCYLKTRLRELWEDHVNWTRNVIFCLVDGLPGSDQAVARLMKNQEDIGDLIKPFYGEEAGNRLTILLKEHISIAAEVINAAKVGDEYTLKIVNEKWYDNANEIAMFLCTTNHKLDCYSIRMMMRYHLKLTSDEAICRINRDYDNDIIITDKVHKEIRVMSDMIYEAIVKQFPNKF
jgi:hypothetical protein